MLIQDSSITMSAQWARMQQETVSERLEVRVGPQSRPSRSSGPARTAGRMPADLVEISDAARFALAGAAAEQRASTEVQAAEAIVEDETLWDAQTRRIKLLVELITGEKIDTVELSKIVRNRRSGTADRPVSSPQPPEPEWSVEYDREYRYHDLQHMSFEAEGTFTTSDGEMIKFSLNLSAHHEESVFSRTSVRAGSAKKVDPIIINFTDGMAALSETLFEFDLDSDGSTEMIPGLRHGSGFLVLDRNGDGVANDGTELFGPATGNGMDELAEHDSDGNGWIDSRDNVWTQLYVWTDSGEKQKVLTPLSDAGVEAIYLGSVDAQFQMKNGANRPVGELARMGIYVRSDKTVGSIQQVDFLV